MAMAAVLDRWHLAGRCGTDQQDLRHPGHLQYPPVPGPRPAHRHRHRAREDTGKVGKKVGENGARKIHFGDVHEDVFR
ncbi:hypothetical protein Ait01nite_096940 [Actinoplanes italicus]|nr:hypothetical protein Ait01nite_096940 [Actinoplanes italicus]